ncbi:MAG TPA: hypothetical protein VJR89_05520 [Polyangiales bacterium]|nr:hypothetical protein [Polyangiales bacterium]
MSEPEATSAESDSDKRKRLIKGCGCTVGLLGLALGILVIGNFDSGAWASALGAVVIGYLVFNLSGVNGFWER